ncbi:MAG TPA: cytochrome P450 [Allosphingosinicella sp.]|jgi:cytochrome P450
MATSSPLRVEGRQSHHGLPVLGSTFEWVKDPKAFSLRLYERYGPVVNVNYFFKDVVFLLGIEANERVLMSRDQEFSNRNGWAQVARLFAGGLMLQDFDAHLRNRRVIQRAFTHKNLTNYLTSLRTIVEQQVSGWSGDISIKAYQQIKVVMLQTAASTFLGISDPAEIRRLNAELISMLKAAVAVAQVNIPGTQFSRGMKSRKYLKSHLGAQVADRRRTGGTDLFSELCVESQAEDSSLSDEDVVEHMIFLVMAAHDTTASLLSSLTMKLAENPEWQERVRDELCGIPDRYGLADLEHAPLTEAVVNETLRLHPPVPDIPRMMMKDAEVMGHFLPKGTRIVISPGFTHHYSGYWKDPFAFDPGRFLEGAKAITSRFQWLPFGAGVHKCIGLHFSYMQSKIFLRALLQRYRVVPTVGGATEWISIPFPHPRQSVGLRPRGALLKDAA